MLICRLFTVNDRSRGNGSTAGSDGQRKQILERLADREVQILKGDVREALLQAVQRPQADALIIGRPKDGLWGRMRGLTYGLIRDSLVPVISV